MVGADDGEALGESPFVGLEGVDVVALFVPADHHLTVGRPGGENRGGLGIGRAVRWGSG